MIRKLLAEASTEPKDKKIHGGISLEETNKHFALRFPSSVMRIQNVVLDTQSVFGLIPKDFIHAFSSHHVSLLDVPCGTGAGGLALLSIIHELRLAGLLPKLPLEVSVLAGDISPHAIAIYESQMRSLRRALRTTGITANLATVIWDALDLASTNNLCELWEQTIFQAQEGFVLVSNFSGAGQHLFDKLQESFRHISVRVSHKNATLLWIEPGDPGGTSFLKRTYKAIGKLFGREEEPPEPPSCEAKWWHDLQGRELKVRSAVYQYVRPR